MKLKRAIPQTLTGGRIACASLLQAAVVLLLSVFGTTLPAHAQQFIQLESRQLSAAEQAEARRIRDGTAAPNSLIGDVGEDFARAMAEGAAQMTENQHHCHASGLSEADKNFCLAIARHDQNYCHMGRIPDPLKTICLGYFDYSKCHSPRLSEGAKEFCLALGRRDMNYCHSSRMGRYYQYLCKGHFHKTNCFGSSPGEAAKNLCLGISKT